MNKKVQSVAELDVLVERGIIHASEKDWMAKGIDNGYLVGISIEPEEEGKFPATISLIRQWDIIKKTQDVTQEAKIIGLNGQRLKSNRAERRKADKKKKKV